MKNEKRKQNMKIQRIKKKNNFEKIIENSWLNAIELIKSLGG